MELIPNTRPSSYDNYLKILFRSVTYSVAIVRYYFPRPYGPVLDTIRVATRMDTPKYGETFKFMYIKH